MTQNRHLAGRRRQQSFQDLNRRGLPCAVRTKQSEALSHLNFEVETADGFHFAVVRLAQIAALDGGRHPGILPAEETDSKALPECNLSLKNLGWSAFSG